jgi:hypothetical protein
MIAAGAASGSDAVVWRTAQAMAKPPESGGFSLRQGALGAGEKSARFAGHQGVALLNDRPCESFPDATVSGA